MNLDIICSDIILAFCAICITTGTGGGFVFFFLKERDLLTRIILSFVFGFVLLSLSGILAYFLSLSPVLLQVCIIIPGCILLCIAWRRTPGYLLPDRWDKAVLILTGVYILVLIGIFSTIILWRAGDLLVHASIVRMILDGASVPVSIYPLGSAWEYYPKGFHYYTAFFTHFFPLEQTITIIPVLITAITSLLLYCIVRKYYPGWCATAAFILACFCFPQHYDNLIWGGYPSAAAQMLFVAIILALILKERIVILLLAGLVVTHTRFLIYLAPVLVVWIGNEWMIRKEILKKERIYILIGAGLLILTVICIPLMLSATSYIFWTFSDKTMATEFITKWVFILLAIPGILIAYYRFFAMERLALAWIAGLCMVVLLVDSEILIITTATRVIAQLYLPLAFFAALALSYMTWQLRETHIRTILSILLIIVGIGSMGAVFMSYSNSFALPEDDYQAMQWLRDQPFPQPVCINTDPTGNLVYPLTGIPVSDPVLIPKPHSSPAGSWSGITSLIISDPTNPEILNHTANLPFHPVLLYISSISRSDPDYRPPFFNVYDGEYTDVNISALGERYEIIYDKGAAIIALS
ncbi:MAG: hypothetical protein JXA44_06250 [Methanospirillaceae archaeon]|nr:hypothetical protein [Methanospirillaceae archaeon]